MLYEYFKNTGIQFFGDSSIKLDLNELDNKQLNHPTRGDADIDFALLLFRHKWVPFSTDGKRNLFRVYFGGANRLHYMMAIDTTIRRNVEHSLVDNDVGNNIHVIPDLYNQNEPYDILLPETERWITDICDNLTIPDKFADQDPNVAFLLLINCFRKIGQQQNENKFIPNVKILTNRAFASTEIDTTFVLDFGNSRTIGLLVEKDIQTNLSKIKNAAPLKIIDYSKFEKSGLEQLEEYSNGDKKEVDYLISSKIRFKKNIFQSYLETETFNLPSICTIGDEAENLGAVNRTEGSSGLHGPKRYLWDSLPRKEFWRFYGDDSGKLKGELLKYISLEDSDEILSHKSNPHLTKTPLAAVYPRRTMMLFSLIEIFYQAFTQINSDHYRKRVGYPGIKRKLNKVILSFPTGMSFWERERLKLQAEKALLIMRKMDIIPYEINIELGCDEASCSQIAFLYGEAKRFKTDLNKFFSIVSGNQDTNSIRIASLDIGGGTSDLMIAEYKQADPSNVSNTEINQKILYSDGVNLAGDEILQHLISNVVIPKLREGLQSFKGNNPDLIEKYFGKSAPDAETELRVEAMNGLFIPIAEFYMHIMENQNKINASAYDNIETLNDLNDYLDSNNLKSLKKPEELNYLITNNIIDSDFYQNALIADLIPTIKNLESEVELALNKTMFLGRYSIVINKHRPDFLILAGRTTSLPIISRKLKDWLTISPERIISLKEHYIGPWYPFSNNGVINDPKTAVVIGNSIAAMSKDGSIDDIKIITKGENSDFTLNFIGSSKDSDILNDSNISYSVINPNNIKPITLLDSCNIIMRNIDDQTMKCNLVYTLSLSENIKPVHSKPLEIILDFSDPKRKLKIKNVTGKVNDNNTSRNAVVTDVVLWEKTLFEKDYFLDTGTFDLPSF